VRVCACMCVCVRESAYVSASVRRFHFPFVNSSVYACVSECVCVAMRVCEGVCVRVYVSLCVVKPCFNKNDTLSQFQILIQRRQNSFLCVRVCVYVCALVAVSVCVCSYVLACLCM